LTLPLRKLTAHRSSISRGPYKCDLGCDMPAFKCPKDLRRHINDIHETRTRYRCPADGCKYGGATAGHSIKRKDNFRRHLQNIHNMHCISFCRALIDTLTILIGLSLASILFSPISSHPPCISQCRSLNCPNWPRQLYERRTKFRQN